LKFMILDNHPNDSRVKISEDGKCQALTGRMGTGGNNVPLVLTFSKSRRAKDKDDFETWVESRVSNTLNTFEGGDTRATDLVISYGFEPGAAKRLNPEGRFYKELVPTLRQNAGDNQAGVVVIEDEDDINRQMESNNL